MRLDLYRSHAAIEKIREIREFRTGRIDQLRATYQAEATAPLPNSKHLTPDGRRALEDQQRAAARDRAHAELDRIERTLRWELETIRDQATAALAPPTDPTAALLSEQRQQRAWNRAQTLLNSGRSFHDVIAGANDIDTIEALRAELPTWLTAQNPVKAGALLGNAPGDLDFAPLMRTLDRRLSEILPDSTRGFLNLRLAGDALEPGTRAAIRGMRHELDGHGEGLRTALEVKYADAEAARTIPNPTDIEDTGPTPGTETETARNSHTTTAPISPTGKPTPATLAQTLSNHYSNT